MVGSTIKVVATAESGNTFESEATEEVEAVDELTVSIDNQSPKVGDTLTAIVEGGKAASYAWYILDAVTDSYEGLIPVSTESSYTVLPVDKNKYVQVVVTAANGNEFPSEITTPVINADLSKEVKLTDRQGLQNDGTALPGDNLDLTYGSGLGTPETIAWYKDGALRAIETAKGGITNASFSLRPIINCGTATLAKGEWYVIIQNTEGENFTSNSIVVTEGDLAVMSAVTFTDDYDGKNVELAKNVTNTVVTVTLNKDYPGTFYIASSKTTKFNTTDLTNAIATSAITTRVTNPKKFT